MSDQPENGEGAPLPVDAPVVDPDLAPPPPEPPVGGIDMGDEAPPPSEPPPAAPPEHPGYPLDMPEADTSAWPQYASHKTVFAMPIVGISPRMTLGEGPVLFVGADEADRRIFTPTEPAMAGRAEVGGYAVAYADGFKSVSPKAVFESGYTMIDATHPAPIEGEPVDDDAPPVLAVAVHDMPNGMHSLSAVQADGTTHTMTFPKGYGAVTSFREMVDGWLERLGERATTWVKEPRKPDDAEAADKA